MCNLIIEMMSFSLAIRKEIAEIECGKYSKKDNVFKVSNDNNYSDIYQCTSVLASYSNLV